VDPVGASARTEPSRAPLLWFAVLQSAFIVGAWVVAGRPAAVIDLTSELVSVAALGYGILRYRPAPLPAWCFIWASVAMLLASGVVMGILGDLSRNQTISSRIPTTLAGLGQFCLIIGLTLLSRRLVRRNSADLLDAMMTAIAVYLGLWVLYIEPGLRSDAFPISTAVTLPIATLVIFTTALWLVLGGGLRDAAVALVLLGAAVEVLLFGVLVVLALRTGTLRVYEEWAPLGSLYFALFGAAGLHWRLGQPRRRASGDSDETGRLRIALFVALSLVLPVMGAIEVLRQPWTQSPFLLVVPVLTSGVFLLLIVLRLVLAIRIAQRRADELARRTDALGDSLAEQEELQRQLSYRALHDPLTGLANRTVLIDAINRAPQGPHALLLLDLDQFKDINDTLGHPVGDHLLVAVADRLRRLTPPGGTLTRLGGDEFAVFVEGLDSESALALGERLRTDLGRMYEIGGRSLYVTTSVGALSCDHRAPPSGAADLLRDADLALYAAKSEGKDRVTLFHPELRLERLDHARISAGLRQALDRDELEMHYQPIVEADRADVVAVEALVRWRTEDGQLLLPTAFIPVAEDTGQIELVGAWALRRALRDGRQWFADHGVAVAVNVSGRQLVDPGFSASVLETLREHDLPGKALILEITESSLVSTSQARVRAHLDRLRDHDVRVAIDDFGTGYSSLSYVAQLPVDIVKVDKSFTQTLGPDPEKWAFTRAILQLVASLDKVAVAEGVETEAQADALRSLRCPLLQGFYFARPAQAEVIERALSPSRSAAVPLA